MTVLSIIDINEPNVSLPDFKIGSYWNHNAPNYTFHMLGLRSPLLIATEPFYTNVGLIHKKGIIAYKPTQFAIENMNHIESSLERSIQEWVEKYDGENIPSRFITAFKNPSFNLRPTIRSDAFTGLKLAKDVRCFEWFGNTWNGAAIGPGRYQLLLKASGFFLGSHGESDYVASLHLRVCQIKYAPAEEESITFPILEECLLGTKDFEKKTADSKKPKLLRVKK